MHHSFSKLGVHRRSGLLLRGLHSLLTYQNDLAMKVWCSKYTIANFSVNNYRYSGDVDGKDSKTPFRIYYKAIEGRERGLGV